MEKGIVKKVNLPIGINKMTIEDIIKSCDEFIGKNGNVKMKKVTDAGILTVDFKQYRDGVVISQTKIDNTIAKKDYKGTVKQMYKEGISQKDIGFTLNISQSYVSKLLK